MVYKDKSLYIVTTCSFIHLLNAQYSYKNNWNSNREIIFEGKHVHHYVCMYILESQRNDLISLLKA